MSKSIEFIVILDDGVRKRHRHETTGGKVIHYNKFTAMLASEFHRYLMEDEERAPMLPENVLLSFQELVAS